MHRRRNVAGSIVCRSVCFTDSYCVNDFVLQSSDICVCVCVIKPIDRIELLSASLA
jgi:hypothetical protein